MDSWLADGERAIEDLKMGDRVHMVGGACTVVSPPVKAMYGVSIGLETPIGMRFKATYPAGSPFVVVED